MQRTVLDAGLAVLSLASGPVLGAFLLGTLSRSITEAQALSGMVAGLVTMAVVWGLPLPVAFTWYVFVGASMTIVVAWALYCVQPSPATRSR